jgi:hypothetical protein
LRQGLLKRRQALFTRKQDLLRLTRILPKRKLSITLNPGLPNLQRMRRR